MASWLRVAPLSLGVLALAGCPEPKDPVDSGTDTTDTTDTTAPPPPDTDGDGLSDDEELALGTDPLDPDTDGDGLSDGLEHDTDGLDPLNEDSDADGLLDGAEVDLGTDPADDDTDGDQLEDGVEVASGTNPLSADTDGDGLPDGADLAAGGSPLLADTDTDGLGDLQEVAAGTSLIDSDSDDDLLSDGAEVALGTDPLAADTDVDGLPDGEEVNVTHTDPLAGDTDADGLLDGAEVATHGTEPLDPDTDQDDLLDGDEILVHGTGPTSPDTDVDGLMDGDEVALGTDPLATDTDGDGLSDGDEVTVHLTDPSLTDTDGGSLSDGAEVELRADPLDPDDDVCEYPDAPFPASSGPGGTPIQPTMYTVRVEGTHDGGVLNDYRFDVDDDGVEELFSAYVRVSLFDAAGVALCDIDYDATTAVSEGGAWTTDSGGALFATYALTLDSATADTDCPPLDAGIWGSMDAPEIFDGTTYELGLGELVDVAGILETVVTDVGLDWQNDWEPYVFGTYLSLDGVTGSEIGWALSYDADCDSVIADSAAPGSPVELPTPTGDLTRRFLLADSLYLLDLDVPQECAYADIDLIPAGAPGGTMSPAWYGIAWKGIVDGDSAWQDWRLDFFGTGFVDDVPASLEVAIYDVNFVYLCSTYFNLDAATAVDPAQFTHVGTGTVWEAWELVLDGAAASSSCRRISAALYGTNDVTELLDGTVVQIGVGESPELEAGVEADVGAATYAATYAPYMNAQMFSRDGVNMVDANGQAGYTMLTCDTRDPGQGLEPALVGPPSVPGYYQGLYSPFLYVYPFAF